MSRPKHSRRASEIHVISLKKIHVCIRTKGQDLDFFDRKFLHNGRVYGVCKILPAYREAVELSQQ